MESQVTFNKGNGKVYGAMTVNFNSLRLEDAENGRRSTKMKECEKEKKRKIQK